MSQKLAPARVPAPGRILSRELEARGWTQKDLAEIMGRPVQTINEIIRGIIKNIYLVKQLKNLPKCSANIQV